MCPFNQTRDVGDREGPANARTNDSEVRYEGGKGIVGNLGLCSADHGDKGALPSVRITN